MLHWNPTIDTLVFHQMKQRFSALDIAASVAELQKLVDLRLANIYDINPRTYLLKFHKPDHKELILIESGIRIHSTSYVRDKQQLPSGFNVKLRKHLKTRRLTRVTQIGNDRIVDLQFSEGEYAFHLILEFFATGNIILTDHEYKIMALVRVVDLDEFKVSVGQVYEISKQVPQEFHIERQAIMDRFIQFVEKESQKNEIGIRF